MSSYGREVIKKLMVALKNKAEIVTIKVMGCNGEVLQSRIKNGGPYKLFEGENFEKLNEEVANYADILVIIEGGEKSGTILLADKFIEKGKNVYGVPGRITDKGSYATNWLIKQGANILTEVDDIIDL